MSSDINILMIIIGKLIPFPINIINSGNRIAVKTEPTDTILVIAIIINAKNKQINPSLMSNDNITPKEVATPFPPLNSKNIG